MLHHCPHHSSCWSSGTLARSMWSLGVWTTVVRSHTNQIIQSHYTTQVHLWSQNCIECHTIVYFIVLIKDNVVSVLCIGSSVIQLWNIIKKWIHSGSFRIMLQWARTSHFVNLHIGYLYVCFWFLLPLLEEQRCREGKESKCRRLRNEKHSRITTVTTDNAQLSIYIC